MNSIKLPQFAWHGAKEVDFPLPDGYQVEVCNMAGYNRPALTPDEIKKAIANPIGMPPLREYARGKKKVAIIFDDMTRVTRTYKIVPHVLEELAAAGIPDSAIRFIGACGCHGAMSRIDFAKKLGEDVLARFPVYNHSPFLDCTYAGTTSLGTKVSINAEVMSCDLKITIASIVPHIMVGFGGGGKILLPGVASWESIQGLHAPRANAPQVSGGGNVEGNPRRQDISEVPALAGLDMEIEGIVNYMGEPSVLFAGAPAPTYAAGQKEARASYLSPAARDKDIVIANAYAKANESLSGLIPTFPAVKKEGGDAVLISNAPDGQVTHYLVGSFGETVSGPMQLRIKVPPHVRRLIIYTEYHDIVSLGFFANPEKIVMVNRWDDVLRLLHESYGDKAKVAVYPNADIQYCAGQPAPHS